MKRSELIATATLMAGLLAAPAVALSQTSNAQTGGDSDKVTIGVMTDMSGVLSDLSGPGSLEAVKMAVEDSGGKVNGKPIVILSADHQNKADLAASKANEWFDTQQVDMISDLTNSSVALAVTGIADRKNRIAIVNGAGSNRITNEGCTAHSIHYAWDTFAMANGTARAILKRGGDTWYFLTADYAFGHQIERDVGDVVKAEGGKVMGSSTHPFNASDFSSFMLQAQASGAKIIGLANGGTDTINSIKSAREFRLLDGGRQQLAGLAVFITDIHGAGLADAQGLLMTEAFYWDANDESRKWSKRFFERMKKMPTAIQAANYSSTLHYLNAVTAVGSTDATKVMEKMRATPINDFFATNGKIREDGRMVHDMYLMQVKSPAESGYAWDYYKTLATIPGDQAFQPLSTSRCKLVTKR